MRERKTIGGWLRATRAQRRVGHAAACACGEARPFALISGRSPPICYRCERLAHGRSPCEHNHVFGQHNSGLTIRYPVNDHRAVFSVKQLDWTPETLENPNGDVLLAGIARFHGLNDNTAQMLADCIAFAPQLNMSKNCSSRSTGRTGFRRWRRPRSEPRANRRRRAVDDDSADCGSRLSGPKRYAAAAGPGSGD